MITLNQPQHLGRMAYLWMVSTKTTAGLIMLLVAALLLASGSFLSGFISGVLIAGGAPTVATIHTVSSGVADITLGLAVLAMLVLLIGVIVARLEYANFTFTFEEFGLKLRRGVINITEVTIPYRQMQDVNVERNLVHRMTKTSRVVIDSAGHEEAGEHSETDIILEPLDMAMADEVRLLLQRKIGVQVVEGEKEADAEAQAGLIS